MRTQLPRDDAWIGAIIGAAVLPLLQVAVLTRLVLLVAPRSFSFGMMFSTILEEIGWFFAIAGALLGRCSAAIWLAWLERDVSRAQKSFVASSVLMLLMSALTAYSGFFLLHTTVLNWLLITAATLLLNFPLQWSIALTVAARVAANRLRREAKRDG